MRLTIVLVLALAACDRGQPVPTAADNAQLDDAAERLDRAEQELNEPAE